MSRTMTQTNSTIGYKPVKSLLSRRFSSQSRYPNKELSESQQRQMTEFIARMADGRYQLTSEPCPCGTSSKQYVLAKVDRYALPLNSVLCEHCGTVRLDPYLDEKSLDNFYRELYQELYGRTLNLPQYFAGQSAYGRKISTWAKSIGIAPGARILEVGCGAGGGISALQAQGYQAAGCDYDPAMLDYGTNQGVRDLICGSTTEADAQFGAASFDVAYLHHVFEHVGEPTKMLSQLKTLVKPGGSILIIVPELEFIDKYPCPNGDALKFFHIAHKYNFSREGLAALAWRMGFRAEHITPPDQATGWSTMPELWMRLTQATAADSKPTISPKTGQRILQQLKLNEKQFLRTHYPSRWQYQWNRFRRHLNEYTQAISTWGRAA